MMDTWLEWLTFTINIWFFRFLTSASKFEKSILFYAGKLSTRVGDLFFFSSSSPIFSGSADITQLLCIVNMAPLFYYTDFKIALSCPIASKFGE